MTHRHTALRRTARTALTLAVSGSFLFAGTAAATAAGSLDLGSIDLGSLGSSGFGSTAPSAVETPRLASVDNFRDVAGPGYTNTLGLHLKTGVFYRANAITPSDADLATLASLGLSAVYDLRTDEEVAQKADRLPQGPAYVRVPILSGDLAAGVAKLKTPDDARRFMQDMNRSFVSDPAARAGFAKLLTDLANTSGPQLYHCTAGKDRTGWTSALLLGIAGVSRENVMADYLRTNDYSAASIERTYQGIAATQGQAVADVYRPLLGVDASYLQAGLDELKAQYGTLDNYLRTGLGLSQATIGKLALELLG
ncbi:tyrosine-protein phosphatase [Prescottella agglutinans]|uniref:Protein-tyrosine phosphatase n=1 Tax=Prescottella agglutinans TaxID=1644129 RepID=A0ABT6MD61_9NOCA|nr:tyrosine-protein phosphatase [Prescottella agglutinans]MDH6281334.1 protein-tyrosine phosphatase [Prescottella agglutinans]